MERYLIKVIITAVLIVVITEISKRWTLMGAVVASLPLTSILAMVWLYLDTKSVEKVSALSNGIFWVYIPSLVFFALFPVFLKMGWQFWSSLGGAVFCTAAAYWGYVKVLEKVGVTL